MSPTTLPHYRPGRLALALSVLAAAAGVGAPPAQASPGDLDLTFAGFGVGGALLESQSLSSATKAMAIQPDGKVVLAGRQDQGARVMRYLPNGSLDPTFGSEGIATFEIDGALVYATDLAIQSDGKIVVAATNLLDSGPKDFFLIRLLSNGLVDALGGDGVVQTDFDGGRDYASAVLVQPDGKIVVAGWADYRRRHRLRHRPLQPGRLA